MKTYATVSADFGFLILGIIMTILVCVLPLVHQESLMYIESTKTNNKSDTSAPAAHETLLLEITYQDGGAIHYFATPPNEKKRQYSDKDLAIAYLKQTKPQDVRLRADRRIPHGDVQDLALLVQSNGGRIWQVSKQTIR
ncbi:MAG: hypothetical protein JAZ15_03155 [Candidatus Thiodiazotropha endolucinida]|nr:hypothetical protein [Candidatus Thiodiazotropha taylori]MCW4311992.1 hypothetical protein [Candidatus Thiodiazotropha taylori]